MKELAYGASHEINNPLANISARAQALLRDEVHPERRRTLEAIQQQAIRAHEMISDLMLFARPPKLTLAEFDLGNIVEQVAAEFQQTVHERRIFVSYEGPNEPIVVTADRQQLTVAVKAIVVNAIEAIGQEGQVEIMLHRFVIADQEQAHLEIVDTGPGISAEIIERIFDPFFSGREAGRGLGFGLSKAWRIVTEHGGSIAVSSIPLHETTFTVSLPLPPS